MESVAVNIAEKIDIMRKGGSILSGILQEIRAMVKPGVTTEDLDGRAMSLFEKFLL